MRKFLYFINPISGRKPIPSLDKIIADKTKEKNIPFEITTTAEDDNYTFLPGKIKEEQITDIIICGGDGTVNLIVSQLIGVDIRIGIIPAGSGNGLSLTANIPIQINKALELIFAGNSAYIDAFYINGNFSCMLSGLGLDAQVAHDFAKQKKRGLTTYLRQSAINFLKAKPYNFHITLLKKTFSIEAYFISIANANQFGNNFKIAPKALLSDGLLDIIVVKKMNKIKVLWSLLKQMNNGIIQKSEEKNFHKNEILYFQTDNLIISNPLHAPLHIDGNPAETDTNFTIKILPKAFRLIQPL